MDCKRILVAVDTSENSLRAVSYVGEMVRNTEGVHVELLHIVRLPQRDLYPDEVSFQEQLRVQEVESQNFLEDAHGILEGKGLPSGSVTERQLCITVPSIAQHILRIQKEGNFGTIVVGRRGVSKAEEFLFGSVSSKIVHYAKNCCVWVVG
ncbi:nucleotide-binding universal stress UspA family protein [Desulfobaculum xiamenense]|uniref:Nucleotide-binding universal stress UspA family protein n=1 Tax=Desulfobaculum xiamenense TaxID=995050 RepID=A0A846QNM9_9BACT|nr:universal stress protein [Desulfobaculum xiamenense]NJB68072.1 nucleotide-binding universal stress UspA family protein [Desulfobaculum xiamenense]